MLALCFAAKPGLALAGSYQFLAPPETDLNRVYKINRHTGEVGACQFGIDETAPKGQANFGVTLCYPQGQGAGPQTPSDYRLAASHDAADGSIFRVNRRSGEMSVCYVLKEKVVCTAMVK
ncbi:MAG: hypothetical protein KGQ37_13195 [Hyphomicrobiales bacterium]|nr:hypothetical protein [Hyphomicrobiales bacterium]